ncbi:MAG: riboflavin synthase [Candidatus Marinimicrobia bacterium]|nr:riboflavin synthase [Candidatus Neomarinimicrobiota bacterium]MCF7828895.1 riboflavin synthase [Candidatus Neomarinimicrobiota bacterium]MCF7879855.1 riboflavin synthase [Candidatus Neomarinimicrobiota bacterium]
MFTGIIEEKGTVKRFQRRGERFDLDISATQVLDNMKIDDSISVNGVCLTVIRVDNDGFGAQVVPQTVQKSAIGDIRPGDAVNLERALAAGDRFGGHFVQGHVDGVGEIQSISRDEDHATMSVSIPEELSKFCVDQGSIAIDGISLTIASLENTIVKIAVIPHTLKQTTLGERGPGDRVNIEIDMLSKYVRRHLQGADESSITMDWLREQGY